MSNKKQSSIRLFCTTSELLGWAEILCRKESLKCICFTSLRSEGEELSLDSIASAKSFHSAFLYPGSIELLSKKYGDQRPKFSSGITLRAGRQVEFGGKKVLTIAEIVAEDQEHVDEHPTDWVRWLRKYLDSHALVQWGVIGKNLTTGGIGNYKNIGYTAAAAQLLNCGIVWKNHPSYHVVFQPQRPQVENKQ